MASPSAALRAPLPGERWWSARTGGDRRAVVALSILVGATLAWWALWQPLVRDVGAMRSAETRNAAALADARRMADEIAGLARTSAVQPAADARADLERVLAQQGLRNLLTQQDWKDGRVRLVFATVSYDALIAALEALQRSARLRVVEGTLTARVEPGAIRAELVLAR
jgi:type II secretory pathway component PulM